MLFLTCFFEMIILKTVLHRTERPDFDKFVHNSNTVYSRTDTITKVCKL